MKIIIFEDERHNAERLIQLMQKSVPDVEVAGIIESVAEGTRWFEQHHAVDVIFMDIQLSDGNCFEMFEKIEVRIPIIFTTAYDSFALQAFKVHSVDYLLKPIDPADLQRALAKLEHFRALSPAPVIDLNSIASAFFKREHTRFTGKINNQIVYVKAKDIAYVYLDGGLTWAVTHNNQKTPLDHSLDQLEKLLDKGLFFRINRQLIVHIDAIKKITAYYNNRLILQLFPVFEADAVISRERVHPFKSWLEGREM